MRRKRSMKPVTGINITPLTDIALELLIVFMIATPMLVQSSVNVDLPKLTVGGQTKDTTLMVLIDKGGSIFVEDRQVTMNDLKIVIEGALLDNPERPVVVNGDKEVQYDKVMKVLDIARCAGARKFSLGIEISHKGRQ